MKRFKFSIPNFRQLSANDQEHFNQHGHLLTRRQAIGLGLMSGFAYTLSGFSPSRKASAANQDSQLPAFLVFDLVGGAALAGNVLVGGPRGSTDLLSSYSRLGFDPRTAQLDERFGLPAPKDVSRLFEGIIASTSLPAQAKLKLSSICHMAVDDSNSNKHSALSLIAKYQDLKSQYSRNGYGTLGTESGGRSQLALDLPKFRPEALLSVRQLRLLGGFAYLSDIGLSQSEIDELVKHQEGLSHLQLQRVAGSDQRDLQDHLQKTLTEFAQNTESISLDPRVDATISKIFNLNPQTSELDMGAISAGIAGATLKGFVGPSCIALNGYDYHNGSQATGDRADFAAGEMIGRCVELAHQWQRSFFFQVITDGSCSARENTRNWAADSGDRSTTIMGYYDPLRVPQLRRTQLGHFTEGQIADRSTFVASRLENVAYATVLNYLSASQNLSELRLILGTGDMPDDQVDEMIAFV